MQMVTGVVVHEGHVAFRLGAAGSDAMLEAVHMWLTSIHSARKVSSRRVARVHRRIQTGTYHVPLRVPDGEVTDTITEK